MRAKDLSPVLVAIALVGLCRVQTARCQEGNAETEALFAGLAAERFAEFAHAARSLPVFPGSVYQAGCSRAFGGAVYLIAVDSATWTPSRAQSMTTRIVTFLRAAGYRQGNAIGAAIEDAADETPGDPYYKAQTDPPFSFKVTIDYPGPSDLRARCAHMPYGILLVFMAPV